MDVLDFVRLWMITLFSSMCESVCVCLCVCVCVWHWQIKDVIFILKILMFLIYQVALHWDALYWQLKIYNDLTFILVRGTNKLHFKSKDSLILFMYRRKVSAPQNNPCSEGVVEIICQYFIMVMHLSALQWWVQFIRKLIYGALGQKRMLSLK